MAKSKTKLIFEDDFEDEEKEMLSPEDQAAWEEMETYFSESLNQFEEGQVIHGKIIEISYDEGFHSTKKHGVRTYYDGEDIVTREEYLQVIWP